MHLDHHVRELLELLHLLNPIDFHRLQILSFLEEIFLLFWDPFDIDEEVLLNPIDDRPK